MDTISRQEIVRKIKNGEPLTDQERQDAYCGHILHDDYDALYGDEE